MRVDQTTYSTGQSNGFAYRPSNWERLIFDGGSQLYWTAGAGNGGHQVIRGIPNVHGPQYDVIWDDNRNSLRTLESASVDLVVTSPPYYKQRDYASPGLGNETTPLEYLDNIMETFGEILRVMKPTGSIVYNMGDKVMDGGLQLIPYRFATRVVDEFNLRLVNDITWIKQNPTPHQFSRRLIISTEPFFHFAMRSDYYYDISAFLPSQPSARNKPTAKLGSRYRVLIEESELSASERCAAHKALDEAIDDVWKGRIQSFRMKIRGIHAPAYGGQDGGRKMHIERHGFTIIRISGQRMKRDIIESPVESLPGNGHPAIFPVRVVREIIRLLCPPDGQVLDPYLGSGSSMVAALIEGRNCIGIEISKDYCDSAKERVARTAFQPELMEKLSMQGN